MRKTLVSAVIATLCSCGGGGGGTGTVTPPVVTPPAPGISLLAGFLYGNRYIDATGAAARFNRPGSIAVDSLNNIWVEDIDPSVDVSFSDGRETVLRTVDLTGAVKTVARNARPTALVNGTTYLGLVADGYGNAYELLTLAPPITGIVPTAGGIGSPFSTLNPPVPAPNAPINSQCPLGNGTIAILVGMDRQGSLYCEEAITNSFNIASIYLVKHSGALPEVVLARFVGIGWTDGDASTAGFSNINPVSFDANGAGYFVDNLNPPMQGARQVAIRSFTNQGIFSTRISSVQSYVDGGPGAAMLNIPASLHVDAAGNVYFTDMKGPANGASSLTMPLYIRKLTPAGTVTTVAGPFTGVTSRTSYPTLSFDIDSSGNIYLFQQSQLLKIAASGTQSTFAGLADQTNSQDGAGSSARFAQPLGVAADAAGNTYVADCGAHTVRKIDPSGNTTTLAGTAGQSGGQDGVGAAARFYCPRGLAADSSGNIYVTDDGGGTTYGAVRQINTSTGAVTSIEATRVLTTSSLAIDASGKLYAIDLINNAIRIYDPKTQTFGFLAQNKFNFFVNFNVKADEFRGIAVDAQNNVYLVGPSDGKLRKVDPQGNVTTLPGVGGATVFASTAGLTIDSTGNLYVADTLQHVVRKIAPDGTMTTIAGVTSAYYAVPGALPGALGSPEGIALRPGTNGKQFVVTDQNAVLSIVLP